VSGPPSVDAVGWAFLVFAGVLLPLAALSFAASERRRAAAEEAQAAGERTAVSRLSLYAQTLLTHAVLFGGSIIAARTAGVSLFPRTSIDALDVGAAVLTLAAVIGLGETYWRSRSPAERDGLWVRQILPRTDAERRAWVVVSAAAALAEEVTYRGAFIYFALAATGSMSVAIAASAVAFAAVHAPQGLSGVGYIVVIALLHQALVLFTGTLVLAIAVHFTYDVLAGLWLARRHGL
jgi:membrane protease YdiL (CAAX protease family)